MKEESTTTPTPVPAQFARVAQVLNFIAFEVFPHIPGFKEEFSSTSGIGAVNKVMFVELFRLLGLTKVLFQIETTTSEMGSFNSNVSLIGTCF